MNRPQIKKATISYIVLLTILTGRPSCNSKSKGTEIFRSVSKVSIEAKYMGWACGALTPQVMPNDNIYDISKEKLEYGFTFYTMGGLKTPDNVDDIGVPHNVFKITGYFYYTIENGKKYLHPRFDLISWHPIVPFNIWGENATKFESRDSTKYEYKTKEPLDAGKFIKARKYDLC
jgi:hypothetical protein